MHVKIQAVNGGIEKIQKALKGVQNYSKNFLCSKLTPSLFEGILGLCRKYLFLGSTYCLAYQTKSLDVADVYAVTLCQHLSSFFTEKEDYIICSSSCEKYNHAHNLGTLDGYSDWEYPSYGFTPFFCDEFVFYLLVLPCLIRSLLPEDPIDVDLVRTIARLILELASGSSNFRLCHDDSYDLLFSDEAWLKYYFDFKKSVL